MPDHLGEDMRKVKDNKEEPEKEIKGKSYKTQSFFITISTNFHKNYSIRALCVFYSIG